MWSISLLNCAYFLIQLLSSFLTQCNNFLIFFLKVTVLYCINGSGNIFPIYVLLYMWYFLKNNQSSIPQQSKVVCDGKCSCTLQVLLADIQSALLGRTQQWLLTNSRSICNSSRGHLFEKTSERKAICSRCTMIIDAIQLGIPTWFECTPDHVLTQSQVCAKLPC